MPGQPSAHRSVRRLLEAFVPVAAAQVSCDRRRVGNEAGLDSLQVELVAGPAFQPPDRGGLAVSTRAVKQRGLGNPLPDLEPPYQGARMVFFAVPPRMVGR